MSLRGQGARAAAIALATTCWLSACGKITTASSGADTIAVHRDAGIDVACSPAGAPKKAGGQSCGCAGDCQSGFCVDGVCCDTACTDTCKACNVSGAPGICTFVPAGSPPVPAATCPKSDVATCGLDGTCDGQGSCRRYPAGTTCKRGTCAGAAVTGTEVCDGLGSCEAGPQTICAPFSCEATTSACFPACGSDADCAPGVKCVSGSCGPKPDGAVCTKGTECGSGFCADGVCCNVACAGACVSCNQQSRVGVCWPTAAGVADSHKVCHDQGAAGCGQTGACDGLGACALYKVETVCAAPSCSGDVLRSAGTCDGLGACRTPGLEICAPFRCSAGACNDRCTSDADCVTGQACHNGSCGPKANGQSCGAAAECASGFCAGGVCCDSACTGSCRTCSLPSSIGTCSPVPAGAADPAGVCKDQGATSCGTDGKCDGAGGCRKYEPGTVCASERCASGAYTAASKCDTAGHCLAPTATSCAPFTCNGNRCFTACTSDANCSSGNTCAGNSCGKSSNGAACSSGTQCASGVCAQGVCCATACNGACKSCALAGSVGQCRSVPAGSPDPAGSCIDQGAASCGTDGKCDGAGACQLYPLGTACKGASCPAGTNTFTPASTCNGGGKCATPASSSCGAFQCGGSACKSTCASNADCVAPATCEKGSCGLKANGAGCAADTDCTSGACAQGVCCATACAGSCMSCNVAGQVGTCAPIPAGKADPGGTCKDQGAASCGTNGKCDGAGACQTYPTGTGCGGGGTCQAGVCMGPAQNGTVCAADADCASHHCTDGFCCAMDACGACKSCGAKGSEGTCAAVADGTACGTPSCSTKQAAIVGKQCSKGMCGDVVLTDCTPFNCDATTDLCKVACMAKDDCAPGAMCQDAAAGVKTCK